MRRSASSSPAASEHENRVESWLTAFARQLLMPVARMLVGRLSFDLVAGILRECMIRAARERIRHEQPAKRLTKSAIALMVGIDSRSIDEADPGEETLRPKEIIHPIGALLETWTTDPEWLDPETGHPRDLNTYGSGHTFQRLVRQAIGRSISYSEVLEVLLNHGNVERVGKRRLHLRDARFEQKEPWLVARPRLLPFLGDMYHGFGLNVQRHLYNPPPAPDDPHTTGLVDVTSIPPERLPEVRREISRLMVQRGLEVDQVLNSFRQSGGRGEKFIAGFGWFYWEEPQAGGTVGRRAHPD